MSEQLYDIETWRGAWFYKFGSRYTGPFPRRDDAIAAANRDLFIFRTCHTAPLRASLTEVASIAEVRQKHCS